LSGRTVTALEFASLRFFSSRAHAHGREWLLAGSIAITLGAAILYSQMLPDAGSSGHPPAAHVPISGVGPQATLACPVAAVIVVPGQDIQAVINAHPNGTSFCISPGTYYPKAPIQPRSSDVLAGAYGAVLDGREISVNGDVESLGIIRAWDNLVTDVTIRNLVIRNFSKKCVANLHVSGWTVDHTEIYGCQVGINHSDDARVTHNYIHDNGVLGVTGYQSRGAIVQGNEIAFNNTWRANIDVGAGGMKEYATRNLTIKDNYIHNNRGPGLWCDGDCIGTVIIANRVVDNTGSGIFYEISCFGAISGNTVTGNANTNWGRGQIFLGTSHDVDVYLNTVSGPNGIRASEQRRGSGPQCGIFETRDVQVHDNQITISDGANGIVSKDGNAPFGGSNGFRHNAYLVQSGCHCWTFNGKTFEWADWQAAGQDRDGRVANLR
jgi:hypothetical protein